MPSDRFESEKQAWVGALPQGDPEHVTLGRLVDEDHDESETAYYEAAADPTTVAVESAQRRYRGMLRRRLRRVRAKHRDVPIVADLVGHHGPVRATLRSIDLDPDPRTLPADPARFCFLARLTVGPADGPGEESVYVTVCSPEWLAARSAAEGLVDVRHHVVVTVDQYDAGRLRRWFSDRVSQTEGPDWWAVGLKLSRIGAWEFEDYTA